MFTAITAQAGQAAVRSHFERLEASVVPPLPQPTGLPEALGPPVTATPPSTAAASTAPVRSTRTAKDSSLDGASQDKAGSSKRVSECSARWIDELVEEWQQSKRRVESSVESNLDDPLGYRPFSDDLVQDSVESSHGSDDGAGRCPKRCATG